MASHIPQGAFDGMDDATARLILQLERENFTEVGQHFMARVPPELQGDIAFMTQQQRIELELAAAEFRVRAVEGGQAQESEPVHIINPQGYATTAPAEAPQVAEAEIHHVLPVASAVVDQIEAVDIHLDHSESEAEEVGVHPTSDLSSEISTTPGSPPAEKVEIELLAPSPAATIRVLPENDQAEPKDESTGQNSPIEPSHSITNTVPVTNTLNTAPLQSRQTQFNSTAIPPSPNAISTPTGITLMLLFMIGALSTTITPESASSADASVGQHSSKHENPGPEPAASADPNDLISFDDASSEAFASSFITEHQRFHTENEVHSNKVPETSPLSTFEAAFGQNSWDFSKLEVNENRDFKDGTSVVEVLGRSRSFPEPAWGIPSQPTLETPTISPNGSFTESVSETTTISFPYVGIREQGSVETHECLVCQDNLLEKNTITLPCGHECCQSCLREIFSAACRNENKFPPRCCESHTINLQTYQHYLDVELVSLFREKAIEFATPLPRYYCSNSSCGRMLRPEDIDGHRGGCSKCWEWTCIMCSEHWHDGDCPKDENLQKLLALAEENHWQRCRCGFMIEIHDGCNRMECRGCSATWCYQCKSAWPDEETHPCACRNTYRDRPTATRVTDIDAFRNTPAHLGGPNCTHTQGWESVRASGTCSVCSHTMPQFVYQCRGCRIERCRNCSQPTPADLSGSNCTHTQGWESVRASGTCLVCSHTMSQFVYRCRGCRVERCRRCRGT